MPRAARVVVVGLLSLACAGCSGAPSPEPASPALVAPASAPPPAHATSMRPGPPPLGSAWRPHRLGRCEAFSLEQLTKLKAPLIRKASGEMHLSPLDWLAGLCAEDARGAWAIEVERLVEGQGALEYFGALDGRMKLVRIDEQGAKAATGERAFTWPWQSVQSDSRFVNDLRELAHPFDYDGDGVPEIAMPVDHDTVEGMWNIAAEVSVWTYKAGGLSLYPPAAKLEHVVGSRDVDGDGRPDLLFVGPYHEVGRGMGRTNLDVQLVAHAKPDGTFSVDDEVALANAREQCSSGEITGDTYPLTEMRCARLWGRPAAQALAEASRACSKVPYDCDPKQLKAWAEREPPIRLR